MNTVAHAILQILNAPMNRDQIHALVRDKWKELYEGPRPTTNSISKALDNLVMYGRVEIAPGDYRGAIYTLITFTKPVDKTANTDDLFGWFKLGHALALRDQTGDPTVDQRVIRAAGHSEWFTLFAVMQVPVLRDLFDQARVNARIQEMLTEIYKETWGGVV